MKKHNFEIGDVVQIVKDSYPKGTDSYTKFLLMTFKIPLTVVRVLDHHIFVEHTEIFSNREIHKETMLRIDDNGTFDYLQKITPKCDLTMNTKDEQYLYLLMDPWGGIVFVTLDLDEARREVTNHPKNGLDYRVIQLAGNTLCTSFTKVAEYIVEAETTYKLVKK